MPSIFSRIVVGEIPSHKIAETADYFAFLDIRPLSKGHTLVIPKQEVDYIFDLDDEALQGLMTFAKKVGKALEKVVVCKRIGISVIGLEVPHTHVHLIPINEINDMNFGRPPVEMSQEEFASLAAAVGELVERV